MHMNFTENEEKNSDDDESDAYKGQKFSMIGYQNVIPITLNSIKNIANSINKYLPSKQR